MKARAIKVYLLEFLRLAGYFFASFLPRKEIAVLRGFPAYEDNLLAVYENLVLREMRVVWITDRLDLNPPVKISSSTVFVRKGGFLDFYYSATSRYLFLTHGHFFRKPLPNQTCVNLWHGIPFKKVGPLRGEKKRQDSVLVATSPLTKKVLSKSFSVEENRIFITGQARTDRMLSADRKEIITKLFGTDARPRNIIFWLPTFRSSSFRPGVCDGKDLGNVFNCADFDLDDFNQSLSDCDAVCFVKPHPMAMRGNVENKSRVKFIDDVWLLERGVSLYQALSIVDCLVSDISSVIADFTLLDRPILLLFEDFTEYESNRGFSFSPIVDYLPSKVNRNYLEFKLDLKSFLSGQDLNSDKRRALKDLFFSYQDALSTERIIDISLEQV